MFLLAFAWLAGLAWLRPLALPDEGRYVGVAWEMLRSGNWVTPTLDGLPFFHKPPLFYWITAAALELLGPNEWAARSASILGGATTVAVLYLALREWLGERSARMAALVLATQPLFFGASQYANLDMLVAACISVSILLGARAALHLEAGLAYR
ncbi:MAG TPA: glycosyltransferase family 39 protein, partial [Burkholderiaceae bacterium]